MEKNPYAMAKLGLEVKDNPNKRDCGFYMKYFFLFVSLIEFLIILGLVLFMVYGNTEESTKMHMDRLSDELKICNKKIKNLEQDIKGFKQQLNISQLESQKNKVLASRCNGSLRFCNDEKTKLSDLRKQDAMIYHVARECTFNFHLLNMTCPGKVESLLEQLKALELRTQLEEKRFLQQNEALKEKVKKAEEEKEACMREKLEVQTRVQKYRDLEGKILAKMDPVSNNLRSASEQLLSNMYDSCFQITNTRQDCRSLSNTVQGQLESLSRQIDQKVGEVAQENGLLQKEKATCVHTLHERERELGEQKQQHDREKQMLQEAQDSEIKKMYAERQKMVGEKDSLQQQLDYSKQACLQTRMNSLSPGGRLPMIPGSAGGTNFQGIFSSFGNPGGAAGSPNLFSNAGALGRSGTAGQLNSGSQGSPSIDRFRTQDTRKPASDNSKLPNLPPIIPVGQPSG